ncbi:acyltransferase [Shewanella baltica]|uniref:acyltransferase n=1 Tax=Shewanella baltica TaxID=62322 RepID=UPI003D795889
MITKLLRILTQFLRKYFYRALSDLKIEGNPIGLYPIHSTGKGKIKFGKVYVGIYPSPYYFSSYLNIEARAESAEIIIGDGVYINNDCNFICDKSKIEIGNKVLIGTRCNIIDSDFHNLTINDRMSSSYECQNVVVEDGVFIGSNVTILKGVRIGTNSVVANGSVVTKSFESNVIIAGVPAKIIGKVS